MIFPGTSAFVLALDQISKAAVRAWLPSGKVIDLHLFQLRQVRNPGTAFGIVQARSWLLFLVSVAVMALVLVALWLWGRPGSVLFRFSLGLIVGGALGNIVDRMVLGEVVDFLDFRFWPVFNLADVGIVAGVFMVLLVVMKDLWGRGGEPLTGAGRGASDRP